MSQSPVRRRTSMSSVEDIHPEPSDSPKSTKGALGKLSNTFNNLRESFSSAHDLDHTVWTARSDYAYDMRLLFKRRIRVLYIAFTNLRSFVEVNYSGFRKIIKKYVFNLFLPVLYDICHCHYFRRSRFSQLPRFEWHGKGQPCWGKTPQHMLTYTDDEKLWDCTQSLQIPSVINTFCILLLTSPV